MFNRLLGSAVVAAALTVSAGAFADDPTAVLLQERGLAPRYPGPGPLPAFSDFGPCWQGMQSEPFPNSQGYRCIRSPQ